MTTGNQQLQWTDPDLRANITRLLSIAERQHLDRLRDIELLDRKVGIVLAAQAAVLARGASLDWFPDRIWLGVVWVLVGVIALGGGGIGFFTRDWQETPDVGHFRTQHAGKLESAFQDQLLANYGGCIKQNTEQIISKARWLKFALVALFISILLLVFESFLEGVDP